MINTECLIMNLNDRLKHVSSLQSAMASSLLPIKNQISGWDDATKKQILVQMQSIQKQSKIVS